MKVLFKCIFVNISLIINFLFSVIWPFWHVIYLNWIILLKILLNVALNVSLSVYYFNSSKTRYLYSVLYFLHFVWYSKHIFLNLFCHAPRGQKECYMLSPGHTCGACNHNCSLFHHVTTPWYGLVCLALSMKGFLNFLKPSWVSGSWSFIAYYCFWPFGIFFFKKVNV